MPEAMEEIRGGRRFAFGANWRSFLRTVDEDRIREAERSLQQFLRTQSLDGKRFLDVGSGSGLSSLAARRLGADVVSFDYDPDSVESTLELRRRYYPDDSRWDVRQGSVLDLSFLESLGRFDIVYAWGVLHHTGDMWQAMANVVRLVAPHGKLYLGLYNDQGTASKMWTHAKRTYNRLPWPGKFMLLISVGAIHEIRGMAKRTLLRQNPLPFATWRRKKEERGMSEWHDLVDWVGGYPFEVAAPDRVFEFYRGYGFRLDALQTTAGYWGCNQYVFARQ